MMFLLYPFDLSVTLLGGRVAVVVLLAAAAARRRRCTPRSFQRLQPFLKVVETMHQLHAHSLPKRIQFRQRLLVPLLCDYVSFFASPFPLLRDIFDALVRFSRALFVDFFHQTHHLRERFQFFLIVVATMMCFHFVFFAVITVITTAVVNLVHLVVVCVVNRRGTTGKILAYYKCVCVCVRARVNT